MNIYEYIDYIIENMLGFHLADIDGVFEYFSNTTYFTQAFNPVMFLSAFIYIMCGIGLFQICCVYPFRLLKKLIKYPSRKACEK